MEPKGERQETFGAVLRHIRLSKDMTQRQVARVIDMDFSYFSRLETDHFKSLPTRETIEKIADSMKCTEAERAELLAAAGRVAVEMQERPDLRRLFRTATQLSSAALEELVKRAEQRLNQQHEKGKGRKGHGRL